MAKDPVCRMYVEEKKETITQKVEGVQYYFCSNNCLNEFMEPEKELKKLKLFVIIGIIGISLTIPISFLTYVSLFESHLTHYILFALATPVQLWIGWRFYQGNP